MVYPCALQTKQCPHCGSNLVDSELLLPETCEPGAFHSRLLGVLTPDNKVAGWKCPDCLSLVDLPEKVYKDTCNSIQLGDNRVNSLESRIENLEELVITLAECLASTQAGTEYNISSELEWFNNAWKRIQTLPPSTNES